ncbi:MAG: hypothetical protein EPN84_11760 [Legionella sp.]|nr:MAG: hypothetical protein EPN84_11760 [Legionella sp.]
MSANSQNVQDLVKKDKPKDDETQIFTPDEFFTLPFQEFSNVAVLKKNRNVLNELEPAMQVAIATQKLLECPEEELNSFGHIIDGARDPINNNNNSFIKVLATGLEVKRHLNGLADHNNKKPYLMLLGTEYNPDIYEQFKALTFETLKGKEFDIAIQLAMNTPEEEIRDELSKKIRIISSTLFTEVSTSFMTQRNIERLLLGINPEQFFLDRDFNTDTYNKFGVLFTSDLIQGQESVIAKRIVDNVTDTKKLSNICKKCEALTRSATDGSAFFKLLNAAISAAVAEKTNGGEIEDPVPPATASSTSSTTSGTTAGNHPDSVFGRTADANANKANTNANNPANNNNEKSCCTWW